jgi:hypothetical protein
MPEGPVRRESPVEFFKDAVERAMQRQRVETSEWTVYYLVNLLASQVWAGAAGRCTEDEPLGLRWIKAMQVGDGSSRHDLRQIGDQALFVVGFFGDSLQRRFTDVSYYVSIGGHAYRRLAQMDSDAFADVFGELSEKFVPVVDVLSDISEQTMPATNQHVLRIYERWLQTGSERDLARLAKRGLSAPASRRVQ